MKDIAVYRNTNRDYITIFTFSEVADKATKEALSALGCLVRGPKGGRKPGSKKYQVYSSKEQFNKKLKL